MRIHALSTGSVQVKHSFLFPREGARRQLDLLLPGPFSEPLPIHLWAIEHEGRLTLIDSGETAAARNIPFARFGVTREQELPGAFGAAGLDPADVAEVVLTHHHGDHVDGLVHVSAPVRIHSEELVHLRSTSSRVMRRLLRQPLPPGFAPTTFELDGSPFGAFPRSLALSADGRIVAVPTPGHTPGHISVVCIDDEGRHVMLAGDATDTLEQLHSRRADAVGPDPAVHRATLGLILDHCAAHPTVYLPSHDPDSAQRLRERTTVDTGAVGASGTTTATASAAAAAEPSV
jgi:glyoxylase-like metal-dependent hydrolase (beta-lactamase superfamily II)